MEPVSDLQSKIFGVKSVPLTEPVLVSTFKDSASHLSNLTPPVDVLIFNSFSITTLVNFTSPVEQLEAYVFASTFSKIISPVEDLTSIESLTLPPL